MTPALPSNETNWRKARIVTLVWIWLFPVTTLSRGVSGLEFNPRPLGLIYPSVWLAAVICAIALQIYALKTPPPTTLVRFYPTNHDATEYMRLFFAAVFGWIADTSLNIGMFDRIMYDLYMVPPGVRELLMQVVVYVLLLGPIVMVISAEHTDIDSQKKTVTRYFLWPRVFPFSEVNGLGEIRVHGRGVQSWVALFPKSGAPWKLRHTGADFTTVLAQAINETGLPAARASS